MSVLCGTDFSAGTDEAIRVAASIAGRRNEPLHLLHAMDLPLAADWDEDLRIRARDAAALRLRAQADRARGLGRAAVEESLLDGSAEAALVSEGSGRQVSLIVLGALGRGAAVTRRTGGTAERVAASAKAPVLLVRAASPIEGWLRGERTLKVVVGDDLTPVSSAALRWAADLRALGPCEIVVGHVFSLFAEKTRLGIGGPLYARLPELEQANLAALRRHAEPSLGAGGVRYRVEGTLGRAAEPLLDIASEEAADLLVVGTGQWSGLRRAWHGWASQIALNDAHCSVACIPMGAIHAAEPDAVPTLRRVLVATDFSTAANQAVAYAHAMVADGGTVHILHVAESDERPSIERLRELIPEGASGKRVETRLEVVSDASVPAAITAAAERLDVDVVCLGTHGRSGLTDVLLGSVAQAVAERCLRQVLLLPPQRAKS